MKDTTRYRILLVCSGNTCRSSMAEAILRDALARHWPVGSELIEVHSAGTMAAQGQPASEHAVTALRELDLDISAHRSQPATADLLRQAGLVLTMTRGHKTQVERLLGSASGGSPTAATEAAPQAGGADAGLPQVYTLLEYAYADEPLLQHDVPDPFGASLEIYRDTAAALAQVMSRVVERLRRELGAAGPSGEPGGAGNATGPDNTTNAN